MKINHNYFTNLAFNLAELNLGKTNTNPSVGCVVVKNNSVLSSGVTSKNGRPHAEYNALRKEINFKDCDMYITLEPCTHYGLTPPCTNIIKNKKVKKVYYCFDDPDTRTNKRARKILNRSKVSVRKITSKKNNFYKGYFLNKKKKLPLIDAKIALSKDFLTINRKSKWITNDRSRKVGHLIRSRYDAILSTSKSINKDNSLLNCRINGFDYHKPDLFIIDRNLKIKNKLKLFNITKKRKTYLFTNKTDKKKVNFLKKKNIKVIQIKELKKKYEFIHLFQKMFELGKTRILVEAGLIFLNELLRFKLINDLYVFTSNKKLKNNGYNNTFNHIKKYSFKNKEKVNLNGDFLHKIRIR